MTTQAFAAVGLFGATAVGTGAIFRSVIELVRNGWSLRQGLSVSLTASGTLAVVASICGVA